MKKLKKQKKQVKELAKEQEKQTEEKEEQKKHNYDDKTRIFQVMRELFPYVMIVVAVIFIRSFMVTPVKVDGDSMYPYLKDGQILLLNKMDHSYNRFDVVVVNVSGTKIIKRIIGMPGETIAYRDCQLYINGKEMDDFVEGLDGLYNYAFIPKGYYFVMGDNRAVSSDSRDYRIGLVSQSQIEGTTSWRLFPFNQFGKLK